MRGYLALIVIAILAPVLLFAAILFTRYYHRELSSIDEDLMNNARELSLTIDREIQGQLYTLQTLSISQPLKNRDFETFYQQALAVRRFTGVDVLLRDRNNQQLMNTRLPWGTPLPRE